MLRQRPTDRTAVSDGSCMIRPRLFLVFVALLLGAVDYLAGYAPPNDLFNVPDDEIAIDLTAAPVGTVAALKIRHATLSPPFDIGLFGDSRILSVSANDLGLPGCRAFNFALSGESMRASVALIEHLASIGKVPHMAVIGIDNFESQYFGNPMWPPFKERWSLAAADVVAGWSRADVSLADWMRMVWRHFHTEGELFRFRFERRFIARGFNALFLQSMPPIKDREAMGRDRPHYRRDGSLSYDVAGVDEQAGTALLSAPEQIMAGYMRRDLRRLAEQQKDGRRLLIYESPVAPASARRFALEPSPYARRHRDVFLQECERLGLACFPDPGVFASDAVWRDASHPPPRPLGSYIRTLLSGLTDGNSTATCNDDL